MALGLTELPLVLCPTIDLDIVHRTTIEYNDGRVYVIKNVFHFLECDLSAIGIALQPKSH